MMIYHSNMKAKCKLMFDTSCFSNEFNNAINKKLEERDLFISIKSIIYSVSQNQDLSLPLIDADVKSFKYSLYDNEEYETNKLYYGDFIYNLKENDTVDTIANEIAFVSLMQK